MSRLEVQSLRCGYHFPLLEISFHLEEGEYLFLKGANGLGKTTFVRTLVGILPPLQGEALFNGKPIHKHPSLSRDIFYLPEKIEVPEFLTPLQYVDLIREYYEVPPDHSRFHEGLALLNITPLSNVPMRNLSMGQKRRAQLLAAYVLQRKLTVLDDPLIAIDGEGEEFLARFIHHMNQHSMIVLTSRGDIATLHATEMADFCVG